MAMNKGPVLVFGATGQQGGSVANALVDAGWQGRALARDTASARSKALGEAGVELVQGSFADEASLRSAMQGAYGVFSVQPSSPQAAMYGISDEDEVRYGILVADIAAESGVGHFVYSSTAAVSGGATGMGHMDSKAAIEAHIRNLDMRSTIIRPATFMEMLLMPGFGLDAGRFEFFMKAGQSMQVIAVPDIGRIVAAIFAAPDRFAGRAVEIAGDSVSGEDLEAAFSEAAGRRITYSRFSDELLATNDFIARLTALNDRGRLRGNADLDALRELHPGLQAFRPWLASTGREAFMQALGTGGPWGYGGN